MNLYGNKNFLIFFFLFGYTWLIFMISNQNGNYKILNATIEQEKISREKNLSAKIREITNCMDRIQKYSIIQHGSYWILSNIAVSEIQFECSESITYVTHGDYTFLDNLIPVVNRWKGPVSIALYAPGEDFQKTVESIRWLRQCGPENIKQLVTFHIYFENSHIPEKIVGPEFFENSTDCLEIPPFMSGNGTKMGPNGTIVEKTYRQNNSLQYPINVGRNIARNGAQTHYHLVSDLELYPSIEIIPKFLEMIARNASYFSENPRFIFPLPVFEVEAGQEVPERKIDLQKLLREKKAFFFHHITCPNCHRVPGLQSWINQSETQDLNVFISGKRTGMFKSWEPIFIGTNSNPFYEERQSWEGMRDKMTQGYVFCVLDYNFLVLDNAFLCHRPGIKTKGPSKERYKFMGRTQELISKKIFPELKILYGEKEGCHV